MSGVKLVFSAVGGEKAWRKAFDDIYGDIAQAATASMEAIALQIKRESRQSIAAAGFSTRFQNALRVEAYPKPPKKSVRAVVQLWHDTRYAGIFETGGTIKGKPLLWVPLRGIPTHIGKYRTSPSLWTQTHGPLVYVNRGGHPTLWGKVGKEHRAIFVGLTSVTLTKRFKVIAAVEKGRDRLPQIFEGKIRNG